jgi:hypothetical protein
MKIFFWFLLSLLGTLKTYCQKDTALVTLQMPRIVTDAKQFTVQIKVRSYYNQDLLIAVHPIFSDKSAEFGDIKFILEKLSNTGCFEVMVVDSDPVGVDLTNPTRHLSNSQTINFKFDIREIFFIRKGTYRIKSEVLFSKHKQSVTSNSDWVYFEVKSDRFANLKSL